MTFYLVKATPKCNIDVIHQGIDNGIIRKLVSFGRSLQYSLEKHTVR